MNRKALLLVTIFAEGGLFLLGLLLLRFSQLDVWANVSISWNATFLAFLLCIPMLALLFFFDRSNWEPMSRFRKEINEKIVPIFATVKLPDLVLVAFFAGVGEELFFRGWMQGALTGKFEVWLGILIASAIFGLAHYISATYAVYAALMGLYLGVIYQISGNLYIVMAIHAIYDFIALVYLVEKGKRKQAQLQMVD